MVRDIVRFVKKKIARGAEEISPWLLAASLEGLPQSTISISPGRQVWSNHGSSGP
jgi:hypothetical protein